MAACGDLGDVRPVTDIALPIGVISHGEHSAIVLESYRVIATCGDLGYVRPVVNIALPGVVVSHGDHGTVVLKPYPVIATCGHHGRYLPLRRIQGHCRSSARAIHRRVNNSVVIWQMHGC